MRRLGIATGGDDRYATGTAVALYSSLSRLAPDVEATVYLLDGGFTAHSRKRLGAVIERCRPGTDVIWCSVDDGDLAGLPIYGYLSRAAYLRLFLGRFVRTGTGRVLYVDCDTLTVRDLSCLADLDMKGYAMAAARDFLWSDISHLPAPLPEEQCGEWHPDAMYLQSGVLLIDFKKYEELQLEKKAVRYATRMVDDPKVNSDQDVLSVVLAGCWLELPCEFNFTSQYLYLERFKLDTERSRDFLQNRATHYKNAYIYHFAGNPKAWHHWSTDPGVPLWLEAFKKSGWLDAPAHLAWRLRWSLRRAYFKLRLLAGFGEAPEKTMSIPTG